nr:hypothetical protein [Tanacetum cinerariifolium]
MQKSIRIELGFFAHSFRRSVISLVKGFPDGVRPSCTTDATPIGVSSFIISSESVDTPIPEENLFHHLSTPVTTEVGNALGKSSYANVTVESIRAISDRFAITAYGFFLEKGWHTLLLLTISMNGLAAMLENGPWFIQNNPLILKKWPPNENLLKEDVNTIPVWVKLYGVPVMAFNDDGLSAIATKLDNIVVAMPRINWGATLLAIFVLSMSGNPPTCSCCKVFGHVYEECPKNIGAGATKTLKKTSQTPKGISVRQEMGFKPKHVFQHVSKKSTANTRGKMNNPESINEVSKSNLFEVLTSVENDEDLGMNEGIVNSTDKGTNNVGSSNTHIGEKIKKKYNEKIVKDFNEWSSYARVMIEFHADVKLKDNIVVAMPRINWGATLLAIFVLSMSGNPPTCSCCKVFGHVYEECPKNIGAGATKTLKKTSQTPKGISVRQKMGFKPKHVFQHVSKKSTANTRGKMNNPESIHEVSKSNLFEVLTSVENDEDLGMNEGIANSTDKGTNNVGSSNTHIAMWALFRLKAIQLMQILPRYDELRRAINSLEWDDLFILYYHRVASEDLRLANEINGLCAGLIAVIEERKHFINELDILRVSVEDTRKKGPAVVCGLSKCSCLLDLSLPCCIGDMICSTSPWEEYVFKSLHCSSVDFVSSMFSTGICFLACLAQCLHMVQNWKAQLLKVHVILQPRSIRLSPLYLETWHALTAMMTGCFIFSRQMQLDDIEKASRLLLMARETQMKMHEKNTFIVKLRGEMVG